MVAEVVVVVSISGAKRDRMGRLKLNTAPFDSECAAGGVSEGTRIG